MKRMMKRFLVFFLISISYTSWSQCTGSEPVLFLGNDTTLCQGSSITLTAPNGYGYYNWSDNTHNTSITVSAAGNYSVEVGTVLNSIVVNGTFESGNTGFTTSYAPGSGGSYGTLTNAGEYAITTNPNLVHNLFSSCADHTTSGPGKMLVVNGAGTPNSMVWSQTVTVTTNTDYQIGAWVMSVVQTSASNLGVLQFAINGVQIGPTFSPDQSPCIWTQFTNSWNSGSSTSAVLTILNQNTVNTGNDFALDDITFSPVCKKIDDINITISPLPTQTTTLVSPSACSATPDGSITINCATGVQYSFNGGTSWQTSNVLSGLAAGTYTIMSKNAAGCTVTSTVTLTTAASTLTQTTTLVSPTTCTGPPDGSITINSASAVQFSFDGGATWGASNTLTAVAAGNYTVMSMDAGGCTASSTVTLTSSVDPQTQTTSQVSPTTCTGPPDGSITINSSTATQYSFDGGSTWQASNVLNGIDAGTYTVMSQNASGCTASSTVSLVSTLSTPSQTTTFVSPNPCSGVPDGSITINSTSGTQYSFDAGTTWVTTNTQSGLAAGTYTVMSQNTAGCSATSTVVLTGGTSVTPTISVSQDLTICQNGMATLTATGSGGTTFTYHWDDFTSTSGTQTISPSATGYYGVYVENENGCISSKDSILVTVLGPLAASVTAPVTVCSNQPTSLAVLNVSGGMAPYSYVWAAGTTIVGMTSSITQTVSTTTNYSVLIKDGCTSTFLMLNTSIIVAPFSAPVFTVDDNTQCEPAVFTISNGMDPAQVATTEWEISNGDSYANQNQITLSQFEVGSYDVTLIVTSIDGCSDTISVTDALTVYPKPVANFTYSPTNIQMFNTTVDFTNQSTGADSYIWRIDSGFPGSSTQQDVTSTLPEGDTGDYTVMLVAISDQQCMDSIVQVVTVYPEQIFYAPNSFTPNNGDGINPTWRVYLGGFDDSNYDLTIFNRWGQIVWTAKDANSEWDGTYKGERVQDGIYSWSLVTKDIVTDKKYYFNGNITVVR